MAQKLRAPTAFLDNSNSVPAPVFDNSHPVAIPASGNPTHSSGYWGHLHGGTQACINKNNFKITIYDI